MPLTCEVIGCGQEGFENIEVIVDIPTAWGGCTTKIKMFVCPTHRNVIWNTEAFISVSRAQVLVDGVSYKPPTFTGFTTQNGLSTSDDRIMPGAIKEQFDVPVKKNFGQDLGEILGTAHVKPDGVVEIELNDEGVKLFKENDETL